MSGKATVVAMQETSRGESARHLALKDLALAWAASQQLTVAATEVPLPRSNYRADVAACTRRITTDEAVTAVFECKVSRSDFLTDAAPETALAAELTELAARLTELRSLIGAHRPDLRRGEELFPQFDCFDLRGLRHDTHDRLTRRLRVAQRRLLEGTKFARLARWRSASFLYLVAEPDLLQPWELPEGWGWLEAAPHGLVLRAKPSLHPTTAAERVQMLERIAARLSLARPFVYPDEARSRSLSAQPHAG